MNKHKYLSAIFVLTLLLFNCAHGQGQVAPPAASITIDFKTKGIEKTNIDALKAGDFYLIKVANLNTWLYKVDIVKADSNLSGSALTLPGFAGFGTDAISGLLGNLNESGIISVLSDPVKLLLTNKANNESIQKLIISTFNKGQKTLKDSICLVILNNNDSIKKQTRVLEKIRNRTDSLMTDCYAYLLSAQAEDQTLSNTLKSGKDDLKTLHSRFNGVRKELGLLAIRVEKTSDEFAGVLKLHSAVIDKDEVLKDKTGKITEAYAKLGTTIGKAQDAVSADSVFKILSALVSIENNAGFSYTSIPLLFTKEQADLKIEIKPRTDDSRLQNYSTRLLFPIEKKLFAGVSSSLFVSNLYDQAYSVKTRQDSLGADTSYAITNENPIKGSIGISAMIKFGYKICDKFYFQGGLGPGISIGDKIRPRLLTGLGVAYGEKHLIMLDVGGIAGPAQEISKVYDVGGSYRKAPSQILVTKMNFGVYISIGYMFRL